MLLSNISNLISAALLISVAVALHGQPVPCVDPPKMTTYCADACIICDIDGFKGRHDSKVPGKLPSDFCTNTVHNSQWIAFIAGSTNLGIQLTVSNCVSGAGLEMTVYYTRDCENFKKIFNCDGEVLPGETVTFRNTEPLIIGQYYYLAMDGNMGDNCDWQLKVIEGSTLVDPLANSGIIGGPLKTCPGQPVEYEVYPPVGATEFQWRINGIQRGTNSKKFSTEFDVPGIYNICVVSSNVCNEAPATCMQVVVAYPESSAIFDTICKGECVSVQGVDYCATGIYPLVYHLETGCDSLVNLYLEVQDQYRDTFEVVFCDSDTLIFGQNLITQPGFFPFTYTSKNYCDSTITLHVRQIICQIEGVEMTEPVSCFGDKDGVFGFMVTKGTPPFSYAFYALNGDTLQAGKDLDLYGQIEIEDLPAGNYFCLVRDEFGNSAIFQKAVAEPQPLALSLQSESSGDFDLLCYDDSDAAIDVAVFGGTGPYILSSTEINPVRNQNTGLSAGLYHFSVTDSRGCMNLDSLEISQPQPLSAEFSFVPSDCYSDHSGMIRLDAAGGGVPPYMISVDNKQLQTSRSVQGLLVGAHSVNLVDAHGCELTVQGEITGRQIPEVSLPEEIYLDLGDEYLLEPQTNDVEILNYTWSDPAMVSCSDCRETELTAVNSGKLGLQVTSIDSCIAEAFTKVWISPKYKIYSPNIMLLGSNPFHLEWGNDVSHFLSLEVYDRWGNKVFRSEDEAVWNGQINGAPPCPGVFAWRAEFDFINGEHKYVSGNITVVE